MITIGAPTTSTAVKRQASQDQAQVYNVTQLFSTDAGTSYSINAHAADAQNGDVAPDCTITICGQGDCSPAFPLTTKYALYTYPYYATSSTNDTVATFSIQCSSAAYIGLDDVSIVANAATVSSSQAYMTVTQYVTQTRDAITQTQTQGPVTATTVLYSTALSTIQVPNTQYISLVSTDLSTITSKFSSRP